MGVLLLVLMISTILSSALGESTLLDTTSGVAPISYCERKYSCLSCTEVRVCAPTPFGQRLQEFMRLSCNSMYPFCNYTTGSCSSSPEPSCYSTPNATVTTNFTCMRDGYFPDFNNCSVYYYCQDEVAYEYTCSYPTLFYHPGLKKCVADNHYCTNYYPFNPCQEDINHGRKKPIYYTNYKYFIYCGANSNAVAVDRCIGDYLFDEGAQMCTFVCPNAGLFPKNDNCANYFKCSPNPPRGFLLTNMTCPDGQAFSESEYSCVDRSRVPNCNKPYPDLFN